MKKFLLLAVILISVSSFGQLQRQQINDYSKSFMLYKCSTYGNVQYIDNVGYVLFGRTNNQFECANASIILGKDKESAIKTLLDLQYIKKNNFALKKTISVIGYNNSITKIYRSNLISGIIFETTGITGITHAITWINFNKAIENVDNYILYNSIDQNSNEQLSKQ